MNQLIKDNISELHNLCKKYQVSSLFLFGSAARNQMAEESDLDFLISFNNEVQLLNYADNYFDCLEALKHLFKTKIDLVTANSLKNPILIQVINKTKIPIYEFKAA